MSASTSWESEKKEVNIKIKIKRDEKIKNIKNEGNTEIKTVNLPTNHIPMFRQAGPRFSIGAGEIKIGGKEGKGCGTVSPSTSRGGLGNGGKGEKFGEVGRQGEAPGRVS